MAGILGKPLEGYVQDQIETRQNTHGSGIYTPRTPDQIAYLNANNTWVKLASGVTVKDSVLTNAGLSTSFRGDELAKQNVLFNGVSSYSSGALTQRQGNDSYEFSEFGFIPMMGITDLSIKCLNRGSLKKAKVKINIQSKRQFEIFSILYMRLGYTVILEWGNAFFLDNNSELNKVRDTVIENDFFQDSDQQNYIPILNKIRDYRKTYHANYDGLLGAVSNFSWNFLEDGSYEVDLEILSLGDVIESVKSNVDPDKELVKFLQQAEQFDPNYQRYDLDSSVISSILSLWKFFDIQNKSATRDKLTITLTNGTKAEVGDFVPNDMGTPSSGSSSPTSSSDLAFVDNEETYTFHYFKKWQSSGGGKIDINDGWTITGRGANRTTQPQYSSEVIVTKKFKGLPKTQNDPLEQAKKELLTLYDQNFSNPPASSVKVEPDYNKTQSGDSDGKKAGEYTLFYVDGTDLTKADTVTGKNYAWAAYMTLDSRITGSFAANTTGEKVVLTGPPPRAKNPLVNEPQNTVVKIASSNVQYYLRFGYLMEYVKKKIVPVIKGSRTPILDIAYGENDSMMYCLPISISTDPTICIVKNKNFTKINNKQASVFNELKDWKSSDFKAHPANVYLNFDFIISCLSSTTDERGDTNIFDFIKELCTGINKALGGVNNLEPIVDESSNTIKIIDTTPIPDEISANTSKTIQLYGYRGTSEISNFVREVSLKTAISPEFASIATVGATAKGYVKGSEGIAFAKLNKGLTDRFNPQLLPPDPNTEPDEAQTNYEKDFLKWITLCYGFDGDISATPPVVGKTSDSVIKKNNSIVTEYYKYLLATQKNNQSGTIGFIPFKLDYTTDGISGFNIYDKLTIDTSFFPYEYGSALDFIITGVSHNIKGNDWETSIETTVIGKTGKSTIPTRAGDEVTNTAVQEPFSTVSGTSTDVTAVGGTGPKALGTYGTAGPNGPVSPEALTIATIDQIVSNSKTPNPLRQRIIRIAASYVGQTELPGDNVGWYDPKFETKMRNLAVPWQPSHPWCNYFTNLCWTEAYTTGNAIVPSTTAYQSAWQNKLKSGGGYKPLSPGTQVTYNNFAAIGQAISKATAQSGRLLPEPGDMVVFLGGGYGKGHIELVVAVKESGGKMVGMSTIGGNTSATDSRDGGGTQYKPNVSLSGVVGFCRVQF